MADALSSSILHSYSPILSFPPSPTLQLLKFKISCVKTDKNDGVRFTHQISPKRKGTQSLLTSVFSSIDDLICRFADPPLRPSVDPRFVLSGNFAAVGELPPTACEVEEGFLPSCLDGAYIRNGPNPQFIPRGPYHAFDGDGMLHSVRISGGKAVFCSRFVKTYKYELEREIGAPVVLNSFSSFTGVTASLSRSALAMGRILSGQYDLHRGTGAVNTSLAHFAGKLFAICESDLPYSIKLSSDGDIITLGREEAFGEGMMTMTAHPKVDRESGEAFAYRHGAWSPFLTYFRINSAGIKQPEVPIFSKPQASMVHDLAITQNYVVFPDTQIAINPAEILKGNPMVRADPEKIPRLGIISKYAVDDSEMRWIDAPGFNMLHAFNAWEEDGGDTIVMVASNMLPAEHFLENVELLHTSIERIEINLNAKIVRRTVLSGRSLELGTINQAYVGKKNKYLYAAIELPMPKVAGVVKLDLSRYKSGDCTVATRLYEAGCYGGEPCFVAREADNPAAAEDDGYLVSYVHNEIKNESKLIVMDAKSPDLEIVAAVKLPQRVPYGFHGIFVRQDDLNKL